MNKRERELIRRAIRYLHADTDSPESDYDAGMKILCKLAGAPYMDVPDAAYVDKTLAEVVEHGCPEFDAGDLERFRRGGAEADRG